MRSSFATPPCRVFLSLAAKQLVGEPVLHTVYYIDLHSVVDLCICRRTYEFGEYGRGRMLKKMFQLLTMPVGPSVKLPSRFVSIILIYV